jgi:cytochrome c
MPLMRTAFLAAMILGAPVVSSIRDRVHGQSPSSVWSGVYTEAQARRGEGFYATRCRHCHGADLTGMPLEPHQRFPDGPDRIPPLVGPTFLANYEDLPLCDLVERIRISMPRDKPGMLTRKEVVDVVAYLLLEGGFPFGRTELTTRFNDLQEVRILSHKPSPSTPVLRRSCSLPPWK